MSTPRVRYLHASHPTPEKTDLARTVMGEIQRGKPVMDALRHYPLEGGGYLNKCAGGSLS